MVSRCLDEKDSELRINWDFLTVFDWSRRERRLVVFISHLFKYKHFRHKNRVAILILFVRLLVSSSVWSEVLFVSSTLVLKTLILIWPNQFYDKHSLTKYISSIPILLSFRAQPSAWPGQHHRAQRDRRQEELLLRPGPQPLRGCILTICKS